MRTSGNSAETGTEQRQRAVGAATPKGVGVGVGVTPGCAEKKHNSKFKTTLLPSFNGYYIPIYIQTRSRCVLRGRSSCGERK